MYPSFVIQDTLVVEGHEAYLPHGFIPLVGYFEGRNFHVYAHAPAGREHTVHFVLDKKVQGKGKNKTTIMNWKLKKRGQQ